MTAPVAMGVQLTWPTISRLCAAFPDLLGVMAGMDDVELEPLINGQRAEDRVIDPRRVITDIGLDELSLKKRHKLYVTLLTDLSDPARPQILAVARGKDTAAAGKCLDRLSEEQRQQVRTHRVDMGSAYPAACAERPSARAQSAASMTRDASTGKSSRSTTPRTISPRRCRPLS